MVSPGLPDDQWHRETQLWFETGLAKLQANTNRYGNTRLSSRDAAAYRLVPAEGYTGIDDIDAELAGQCGTQRMQSRGQVQNFSVFRMAVLVGTSLLLVVAGQALSKLGRLKRFADGYRSWEEDGLLAIWKKSVDPSQQLNWEKHVVLNTHQEVEMSSSPCRPSS